MGAPMCHFEFMSNDPEKCKAFYSKVLGWEFDTESMPGYTMINPGAEPKGGLLACPDEMPSPCINNYFLVDDVEVTLSQAVEAGGKVMMPKKPIPGVGAFAFFTDPEGIPVGLFQEEKSA